MENGAPRESEDAVAAAGASEDAGAEEKDEEESGGDAEEEAEEETEKPVIVLRTAPYDPRFPSTNQARRPPRFVAYHYVIVRRLDCLTVCMYKSYCLICG